MKKLLSILLLAATLASSAWAQNAVTQGGTIRQRALPMWLQDRQIGDAGGLEGRTSGAFAGYGVRPFAITDDNGEGLCFRSDASGTDTFCLGHSSAGDPIYSVNGVEFNFPGPTVGMASVATNSVLATTSTATAPNGIWRIDYATGNGAPPLFYLPLTGTCAANSLVNDGGSCVNTTGGNSWKAAIASTGVDARQWGWKADHTSSMTTVWNNMLSGLSAYFAGSNNKAPIVYFPTGYALFNTKPAEIVKPIILRCSTWGTCGLVRNYNAASNTDGFIELRNGYVELEGFDIAAGDGTTGGIGVKVLADDVAPYFANWSTFKRVRVLYDVVGAYATSGTGTSGRWYTCWYLNGDASAVGLRDVAVEDSVHGNCTNTAMIASTVRQFKWVGTLGTFAADAAGAHTEAVTITGVVQGDGIASQNLWLEPSAAGTLTISNADNVRMLGQWVGVGTVNNTVTDCTVDVTGHQGAGGALTWTINSPCLVKVPGGAWSSSAATLTCPAGGTLTSAVGTVRWFKAGRTVTFVAQAVITTLGTCTGYINFAMPQCTANSGTAFGFGGVNATTGVGLAALLPNNSCDMQVRESDGTDPGADATTLTVSGHYETAANTP